MENNTQQVPGGTPQTPAAAQQVPGGTQQAPYTAQQAPYNPQPVSAQPIAAAQPAGKSAMGITGFVLGLIALLTSVLPIINNFSAFLAALGLIFAIVGIVACSRGKKSGKGLSIAGAIICVVAFALVLGTQSIYSAAWDEAFSGASATGSTASSSTSASSTDAAQAAQQTEDLAVGTAVNMSDGLTVSVDAVETGLSDYSGDEFTRANVTYVNNGTDTISFNMFDWSAQDSQGAQRNATLVFGGDAPDSSEQLDSGKLAAGGSVSGVVVFEGQAAKIIYSPSYFSEKNNVTWLVG